MNKPLKIGKLLGTGPLSPLLAQARGIATLDAQVQQLLPAALQPHCHVLSVRDQVLVLSADSPVWAARLRFHAPKLVKQLSAQQTVTAHTFRIRVIPPEKTATLAVKRASGRPPDRIRAAALAQAAETVSDPRLKTALLRLSKR